MALFVRDTVSDDLLFGEVHPDLVTEAKKAKGKAVLAAPKSVITDEFGNRKTVWYHITEPPYPLPGEYRKVIVENVGD